LQPRVLVLAIHIIRNLRLLVKLGADAMAHVLTDHRKTIGLHVLLHGLTNIEKPVAGPHPIDSHFQGFLRHLEETLGLIADFSDRDGNGGIAIIAVQLHPGIDRNDIALFQDALRIRHPMDNLAIHRGTQHKLKSLAGGRNIITLASGYGSGIAHHLGGGYFEVHGSGPFHRNLLQLLQNLPHQQTAAPHLLQFSGGFANDHRFSIAWPIFWYTNSGGSLLASTSTTRRPASRRYSSTGRVCRSY